MTLPEFAGCWAALALIVGGVGVAVHHYNTPASERALSKVSGTWTSIAVAEENCDLCQVDTLVLDVDKIAFGNLWERIADTSLDDHAIVAFLENGDVVHIDRPQGNTIVVNYKGDTASFRR